MQTVPVLMSYFYRWRYIYIHTPLEFYLLFAVIQQCIRWAVERIKHSAVRVAGGEIAVADSQIEVEELHFKSVAQSY